MKIYLDLIFIFNFYLDFLILLVTNIVLKRNIPLKRILLGTIIGSFSLIFLFFNINNNLLFILKIILAIIINYLTFGFKDIKYIINNVTYFYMISIILGGFLYYLKQEFNKIPYIIFIIISPIILYIYIKQNKKNKSLHNLKYQVILYLKSGKYILTGFLDTGNKLVDPISNKPIILVNKGIINEEQENFYYIPFNSLNNHNLIKCLKPLSIKINKKVYKNYLIAISDKKFNFDGVECLLNNSLLEE